MSDIVDWRKEHYAWRRRVADNMPETAGRVFALRSKPYMGSGFHYAMEKTLGYVMRFVNDYDAQLTVAACVVEEVVVEGLFEQIAAAERSLVCNSEEQS